MPSSDDADSGSAPSNKDNEGTKPVWKQIADQMTANPLQQVRDAAERWITLLTTLIGVSTVLGLIQGRDSITKLSLASQIMLVTVVLLALLSLAIAIYFATMASEGDAGFIVLDKQNFIAWYRNSVTKALERLKISRLLGVVSIVLVVLALFILLFGPSQPTPETNVLIMQKSGAVVCGTLTKDSAGHLLLSRIGLPPIILRDVVSLSIVSGCP